MINLKEVFIKYEDDFAEFEKCTEKPSQRGDLCAFAILDRLVPGTRDMVSAAEHDEIYLCVEPEELEKVATEEDIANLVRCGVIYNEPTDSFSMFV
jgi:hypothetical protein